ncbi:MAG: molybdopterin molybdenumtransferase MoeA [Pirellulaceae bacterium]|nr:MAG: molybdopterin molybdenumtransferase MoeA [Pirellulaceae bacterium]
MELPQLDPIQAAVDRLVEQLLPLESEEIDLVDAWGRALAEPLVADRDSPPLDVSAMDGYALHLDDCSDRPLPVVGVAAAGHPPIELSPGTAVRIFTGAPIPLNADCVVRREDTQESAAVVRIMLPCDRLYRGMNIRRRGENSAAGATILPTGTLLEGAAVAAAASFAPRRVSVRRQVRLTILNTGDELVSPGETVAPWQIRDSNGPLLQAWIARHRWLHLTHIRPVGDTLEAVADALHAAYTTCDAVLLTGGVSMGDTDYVPQAIDQLGGTIHFHRLPIRPGKPVLGATINGKPVLGLPGNPVSVAVTSRVIAEPVLRRLGGLAPPTPHRPPVMLSNPDERTLDLTWYRLVQIDTSGSARLLDLRGSGDLVALSQSHGFLEFPPGQTGPGPWRFWSWAS